jgi:argininosuccinate lyase
VVWCQVNDKDFGDLTDDELAKVSPQLTPDVRDVFSVQGALAARKAYGGTSPERVAEQLAALRSLADSHASWAANGS